MSSSLNLSDSGMYSCVATNQVGRAEENVSLLVHGWFAFVPGSLECFLILDRFLLVVEVNTFIKGLCLAPPNKG